VTKAVQGLPARMDYSAIPNYYLNLVMPWVNDLEELKLSLHIFRLISRKKGGFQYTSRGELLADPAIIESIAKKECSAEESLDRAISMAVTRGIIIALKAEDGSGSQEIYVLNTPANREAVESGTIRIDNKKMNYHTSTIIEQMPDIFTCYEENIGMLTPMIADELRLAEQSYPKQWIIQAIGEAALNNKRNWRYISRILERWLTEGKANGTYQQNNPEDDPSKYTTGKYQRFVQR